MKIVHVIDSLDPAAGGPPHATIRLAAATAALGHQVHVVTYAEPNAVQRLAAAVSRVPSLNAVFLQDVGPRTGVERYLPVSARRMLPRLIADADFVHLDGVWEPILWAAARVARDSGVPYCISPHGMLDPWSLNQKRRKKALALRLLYREMLDAAAFIRSLNEDEAQLVGALRLSSPIEIVPNGVFVEELDPSPPKGSFGAYCPSVSGRSFIFFMARLHFKKGLDYLSDAFKEVARRCPEVHLVVAGPDGGARSSFEAAIERHGLLDRVHLVGPLYGAEKLAALHDASCFCLPSRQEGFSVAVLEALACGLPVVLSDQCHFPKVASAGAGEIVPLSTGAIADAVERIVSDPICRKAMANAARELVRRDYLWPRIAERMVAAYERKLIADARW